ncbi:TetR/AcrR family transcriptional regulator [Actinomadura verrucosospora]|uniref:TetR/AcrR family transcriptional regulator n=1 Tax=Actinomadura verrucosospora TaxID=46165 RepID=A0A7D3VYU3_ACTVE|nr:TetR/AcrR family transcriptional regulator [Actinomadura verrucosospora]QKG22356.1 TetR/AcrR family transcriptional regulator [Actinomadura verrucosospora]
MRSDSSRTFTELARRRQIVDGAIDVLADEGYAAASLAAIAQRVGISKGVISYHFAGKDELLSEVVASVLAQAGEYMGPRVTAARPGLEALRAYVRSNLDFIDGHRRGLRALVEVLRGSPPRAGEPAPYGPEREDAVTALARMLAEGQRTGELTEFDTRHAAVALRASIDAVTELLRTDPDLDVQSYATDLLRLFEQGLAR